MSGCSSKVNILFGQVVQWSGNLAKVLDEHAVEVTKSDEGSHVLDGREYGPVFDSLDFARFYAQFAGRDLVA